MWEEGNSPPKLGGVAATLIKRCEASLAEQTGWFLKPKRFGIGTTPPSLSLGHPS